MPTNENIQGKIINIKKAVELFTPEFRKQNRIVFTNGCFDLLHKGHIHSLNRARELGDLLVVGLNSDASVTNLKGPGRPVNDQQTRVELIGALASVDYIIIFSEETPLNLICSIKPDILVKGSDYKMHEIVGHREVASWGGEVKSIPLLEGYSTSSIIDKLT